jgi:hypothetical protein
MYNFQSLKAIFEHQFNGKLTAFQIGFLAYFLLMGPGMLFLALVILISSGTSPTLFWILGLIHSGLSIWLIRDIRNDKICAQLMLDALENGGKELAWVYVEKILRDKYTLQRIEIHFLFLNKNHGTISSQQSEFEQFQEVFANTFAHISIGFSEELYRQYKKNPAALKQNPQRHGTIKITVSDEAAFNGW